MPFELMTADKNALASLRDEVMDKERCWEKAMSSQMFGEYDEFANSWRMMARKVKGKPRGLFNSKSGETHRATMTGAYLWFKMLTANDPFFEARKRGVWQGRELTEEDLFATEQLHIAQLKHIKFKRKLMRSLTSLRLMGSLFVETPFCTEYDIFGNPDFEATDFVHRSLLQTGFDPTVFSAEFSDYFFTIDYVTKYQLQKMAREQPGVWHKEFIDRGIADNEGFVGADGVPSGMQAEIYNRLIERKRRAGYSLDLQSSMYEVITYHGRLDPNNSALREYWDEEGFAAQRAKIELADFTVAILNSTEVIRLHITPYGKKEKLIKIAAVNEFESEPLGYGVGKIGKKGQRELDVRLSHTNDGLLLSIYLMMLVSKYAGIKEEDFQFKPFNIIETEDMNGIQPLKIDINAIAQSMALSEKMEQAFRNNVSAPDNLQAIITKASATESAIVQNSAMREHSAIAEIIAETFIVDYLETAHLNNLNFLDADIAIEIAGESALPKSRIMNKYSVPPNIGFHLKPVTDKDYRPERSDLLLRALQVFTSVRQDFPEARAAIPELTKEFSRTLSINPRLFRNSTNFMDGLVSRMQQLSRNPEIANEVASEIGQEQSGPEGLVNSPVGPVSAGPLPSESLLNVI